MQADLDAVEPDLPGQRQSWGLADTTLEEVAVGSEVGVRLAVALALLVFDRRFWTQRPPVDATPALSTVPARQASSTAPPSLT